MGRKQGYKGRPRSARDLRVLVAGIDEHMFEAIARLLAAEPHVVPYDRLHHLTNAEWSPGHTAANTVCNVRKVLGYDSVRTVRDQGYVAGPTLRAAIAGPIGEEAERLLRLQVGVLERQLDLLAEMRTAKVNP